ncbi:MAG: PAS domain S-box protein [Desulfobacterales bacterium]
MKQEITGPVAGGGLIHTESFAEKVLNASLNGIYIYDVHLGRNVFINDQYTALTGYTFEDLCKLDKDQFLALFHPDDQRLVTGKMERLARSSHEMLESEYRLKTKDGRWIWCLSRNRAFARDEQDGSVSQTIGTFLDITQRKKSEEALRQSEEKFSKAFYSSPTFLFISELETGVFVEVNTAYCELTGYTHEQMINRSSVELGIVSAQKRSEIIRRLKEAGRLKDMELPIVTRTGEVRICLFAAELMEYQGRPCLIYSGFDITGRKHAEEIHRGYKEQLEREVRNRTAEIERQYAQLEELNQLVKQMAQHTIRAMEKDRRALSKEIHDSIGGSLAAVKIMLETRLLDFDRLPPDGIISLENIIGYLADAIQEIRRISYQMRTLVLDDFGLAAALSENIKKFKEVYPKIDIVSAIDITEEGISDDIKIVVYRVVQEALNNIGKHSGADRATIVLSESKERLALRIEDNGRGFDFAKAMDTYQPLQGYGMYSMKERIEICKGTFEVTSAPGKGTLLTSSIPKAAV